MTTDAPRHGGPRMIFGVDGSAGSNAALRQAMTQDRLVGSRVEEGNAAQVLP